MILVTGSNGFIGGSLQQALRLKGMAFRPYPHSVNNPFTLQESLQGVDTVIHLATAEAQGRKRRLEFVDIRGTEQVLKACRLAQIRRFILISRLGADVNAWFSLLQVKGEQERMVRASGLPYTIIRSATLFGHQDRFLNHLVGLTAWSFPFLMLPGGGRTLLQPLWVEDLAQAILATLARYDLVGKQIEIAGEERLSLAGMMQTALETAGISRRPITVHPLLLKNINRLLFGLWLRPPVTNFTLERLAVADIADLDSFRHHFGYRPAPFNQNIAYLRRTGHRRRLLAPRIARFRANRQIEVK